MSNKYNDENPPQRKVNRSRITATSNPHIAGSIANTIGTGPNAKDSIVYYILWWCFAIGGLMTLLLAWNAWILQDKDNPPKLVDDLIKVWGILTPIITLSLGYLFGKAKAK